MERLIFPSHLHLNHQSSLKEMKYIFHCGGFVAAMKNMLFLFPSARR